jgi:hypothetical protein
MKKVNVGPACKRGEELISFLYGESNESEARDFEMHLQHCSECESEIASFGQLRESIGEWKHEALSGSTPSEVRGTIQTPRNRSALAALRGFFDLSPLWLKGSVAFACLLFCLFAVMAIGRLRMEQLPIETVKTGESLSTLQPVDKSEEKAIEKQSGSKPQAGQQVSSAGKTEAPKSAGNKRVGRQIQLAGSRRPLSKLEREQLAADLGLTTRGDEEGLQLLGDRINQ